LANIPAELKYTKTHEWVRIEGDTATIGITDFAQGELSDIVYVEVTTVGQELRAGAALGTIEAVKAVSDIYAPIPGTVIAGNERLKDAPQTVNHDPYGDGWIAKLRLSDPATAAGLLDAAAYGDVVSKSAHH
jgi:glycine cleavage system H protein